RLLRLGEMLVQAGRITPAQLETALSLQKETGSRLGEVLVRLGLAAEEDIERYVRAQIEEEIYDLFTWKEAQFEFLDGPPSKELTATGVRPTSLSFDIQGLLLEAARRLDEWSMIERTLPHFRAVLSPTGVETQNGFDDSARAVLSHIDGTKSIHDLVEATLSSRFLVCKSLSRLIEAGSVRALSPEEASAEMSKAVAKGDLERAIRIARNLVYRDPEDLEALSQLAGSLRAAGRMPEAAQEYARLGARLKADANLPSAAKAFGLASECAPEDRSFLKEQVDALGRAGKTADAVTQARRLVEALLADGRSPEAVEAGRLVAMLAPRDPNAHVLLAEALIGARKKEDALGVLLAARAQVPVTEVDTLAELDERIQHLDPGGAPKPSTQRKERVSGRSKFVIVAVLVVVGAGATVFVLDGRARKDLAATRDAVEGLISKGKWDEARAAYGRVRDAHPISFIDGAVDSALADLEAARKRAQGGVPGHEEVPDAAALLKAQKEAEALEDKGDFKDAIAAWKRLDDLAAKAKRDDVAATAKNGLQRVERHVQESEELLRRAGREEESRNYAEACGLVLRLRRDYPLTTAAMKSAYPFHLTSTPPGADVLVEGKMVGKTPIVIHLAPGKHENVRMELAGCPAVSRTLESLLSGEITGQFFQAFARLAKWGPSVGGAVEATPILVDGTLWVANRGGSIVLLDPVTGVEKSRIEIGKSAISGCFLRVGSLILVGTDDGRLHAIPMTDTKPLWSADTGAPLRMPVAVLTESSRAVSGGADSRIRCMTLGSGVLDWTLPFPAAVTSGPSAWRGLALLVTDTGTLFAVDPVKGETSWKLEGLPPALGRTLVEKDLFYVAGSDGRVVAVDLGKRQVVWSVTLASSVPGGVGLSEGRLLLGLGNGAVVSLNPESGKKQWSCPTGGTVSVPPVASGQAVYAGSDDGFVYAIGAADGQVRWKFEVGSKVRSGVLIGTGLIYFGADNGRVYAVEP
ncbi:MAG: PQQ-binding-like beta-propeller repeat protein, partial [Planctomycetota bacterium]